MSPLGKCGIIKHQVKWSSNPKGEFWDEYLTFLLIMSGIELRITILAFSLLYFTLIWFIRALLSSHKPHAQETNYLEPLMGAWKAWIMVFENSKLNKVVDLLQQFHKLILLHYQIGIKGFIHSHILIKKSLSKQCCQISLNNLNIVGNTENKRKIPTQSKKCIVLSYRTCLSIPWA